jgi:hypothetical protein
MFALLMSLLSSFQSSYVVQCYHKAQKISPQKYKNKCIVAVKKKKCQKKGSESVFEFVVDVGAKRRNDNSDEYGEHKLLQA